MARGPHYAGDARTRRRLAKLARRSCIVGAVAMVVACLVAPTAAAEKAVGATSSRRTREEAARAIPYDKLSSENRGRVKSVISSATVFRRMPTQVIDCDPDMFAFCLDNPEAIVNVWEVMGISKMTMERLKNGRLKVADGQGTDGEVEFLHRSHDMHIIYCDGAYEGPLLPNKVRGQCILVMRTAYLREPNGRYYITSRMDAFLHVENAGVEFFAKTFQPLVGKAADYNFVETTNFIGMLSRTSERNPAAIGRLAGKLKRVEPQTRDELAKIAENVGRRASEDRVARTARHENSNR